MPNRVLDVSPRLVACAMLLCLLLSGSSTFAARAGGDLVAMSGFANPGPELLMSEDGKSIFAAMIRGACFGSCPTYSVGIGGSGQVEYFGHEYVLETGLHKSSISQELVLELLEAVKAAEFFTIAEASRRCAHVPEVVVMVMVDDKRRTIRCMPGCYSFMGAGTRAGKNEIQAAQKVDALSRKIDELADIERLIGTREELQAKNEVEASRARAEREARIAELELQFDQGNETERRNAALQLARAARAVDRVLPVILDSFDNPEPRIRVAAARELETLVRRQRRGEWNLPVPQFDLVGPLNSALNDSELEVRVASAKALGGLGPEASVAALRLAAMLVYDDQRVRRGTVASLVRLGPAAAAAAPFLTETLLSDHETREDVRKSVCGILGSMGPSVAEISLPALIGALDDPNSSIRGEAIKALGNLKAASVPALDELERIASNDPKDHLRHLASRAIADIEGD